jgi:hypothetical protein
MPKSTEAALELVLCSGCKNFGVRARKSLHCCKRILKGFSGESSERKRESCRESLHLLRVILTDVGRDLDGDRRSDEVPDRSERYAIGSWRKCDPCYIMAKSSTESCLQSGS